MHHHPEHRARLEDIKDITDEDEMRISETFETVAMDIYQVFDDVINNLEKVDAALRDIKLASQSVPLNKRMMRVSTCVDPECFFRGGPTLITFFILFVF